MITSGRVSYDGDSVSTGVIRFVPAGDTQGPVMSALIAEGNYKIDASGGLPVGEYRVEITATRPSKQGSRLGVPSFDAAAGRQYIPEKYNSQSGLTVEIDPGPAVVKDYALEK